MCLWLPQAGVQASCPISVSLGGPSISSSSNDHELEPSSLECLRCLNKVQKTYRVDIGGPSVTTWVDAYSADGIAAGCAQPYDPPLPAGFNCAL
jgi:hypothetical protein